MTNYITYRTPAIQKALEALVSLVEEGHDPVDAAGILAGTLLNAGTDPVIAARIRKVTGGGSNE